LLSFPGLLEEEHALLVGRDDIQQAVAVEIRDDELGSDAALVIDRARGERDLSLGVATGLEPEEPGGLVGSGLVLAVGPEPLTGDQIFQAVAVDRSFRVEPRSGIMIEIAQTSSGRTSPRRTTRP